MELDEAWISYLRSELKFHAYPPVVLGSGGGSLAQKFHAVMHAFLLEAGDSADAVGKLCDEVCVSTFDLGTEFSLPRVCPVPLQELFPWVSMPESTVEFHMQESADLDALQSLLENSHVYQSEDRRVSLSGSLAVPGILHIIHNAANDVLKVTKLLDKQVDALAETCRWLSDNQSCSRLLERCFSSRVGQELQVQLKKFSCKVYRQRWGSVAFCCEALMTIKPVILYGWSLDTYMRGSNEHISPSLRTINEALTSSVFWASLVVLNQLYELVRSAFRWSEGCPCHCHLDWKEVDVRRRRLWEECPLRGLRVPELCAGEFFKMFEGLQRSSAVALMQALPVDLRAADKSELLQNFERGRAHLYYTFTLKLAPFKVPPLLVCGAAHHSAAIARDALSRCLASSDTHPKIKELQSDPIRSEAVMFCDDSSELSELPHLQAFVTKLKFAFAVERKIEGGHAKVFRRGRPSSYHTEAFDSLALRFPEIKAQLQHRDFVTTLAKLLDSARSPKQLVTRLGFHKHPALSSAGHPWSKLYRQVIYRGDRFTLYRCFPPRIHVRPQASVQRQPVEDAKPEVQGACGSSPRSSEALVACPEQRGDVVPTVASAVGQQASVVRDAALRELRDQLDSLESSESLEHAQMYSCPMPKDALLTLTQTLHAEDVDAEAHMQRVRACSEGDTFMFFSIVSTRPDRAKIAMQNQFRESDIAISIHEQVCKKKPHVWVTSTPSNVATAGEVGTDAEHVTLMLTTHLFPLLDLLKVSRWNVEPEVCYIMDMGGQLRYSVAQDSAIDAMVTTPEGADLGNPDADLLRALSSWQDFRE